MVSVQFHKYLEDRHFVVGGQKNFKLLSDISFDTGFQKNVLSNLLLFSFACVLRWSRIYSMKWIATTTVCRFNNSWRLYLHFSRMINLCANIWFTKNSKCQQCLFWRKSRQKTHKFFIRNESFYWYECWRVLRDFCGLSKKCSFATFPKI